MNLFITAMLIESSVIAGVLFYLHYIERQYFAQRRRDIELIRSDIARREQAHRARNEQRRKLVELVRQELAS